MFWGFCLLFWSLSCLESCGRLLGKIPTKSGPNPWDPLWAVTKKPKTFFFEILNFNFSALTVWFFNFWPQIRILRVEILLGHISACLKTSILKFRLLWIYSCFSLTILILSDVFDCFWLLFWSRSCLKSSGRLLGTISTKSRPNPSPGVRVISCHLRIPILRRLIIVPGG